LARLAPDEAGAGFEPAPRALPAAPKRTDFLAATNNGAAMKTVFLLMAQYDGKAAVPVETIARDYFGVDKGGMPRFLRKLDSGEIPLPVMRMEKSQKGARLISLQDLAAFLDERRADAQKELQQTTA
jgi:hypothetical protein